MKNIMEFGMHEETLHPPKEWEPNKVSGIIIGLLSNELSGNKWKQFTIELCGKLLEKKYEEHGVKKTERHRLLVTKKINKATTMEGLLTILSDEALGGIGS
jgi:hypothetical protein